MGNKPTDKWKAGTDLPKLADDVDIDGTQTKHRADLSAPVSTVRDRPFLIILEGGNVGEMFPLKQPETIIGRAQRANIRIEDDGISRQHARLTLTLTNHEVHVEDLKSANGTLVNGLPVSSRQLLKDGDKITLGSTTILKFTYSDELEVTFQRKMLDAALRDGLTGAYNKRYLMDRLGTELAFAQRHKVPLSLIIMDVDHFKNINDRFGHPTGDEVLVKLARVVQETIRREDVFARYGGEEFVVLCRNVGGENATVLAERLRERVQAMAIEHDGEAIVVTASFGVAGYSEAGAATPERLIAVADEGLYEAKQTGRNRVVTKQP